MSATPRIYADSDLAVGGVVTLDGDQAHYLLRVMRLGPGAHVRLFNGRDGEFAGRIGDAGRTSLRVCLDEKTRDQSEGADLWLLFAPLKKDRTDFVIEKAVEMGVAQIMPVITERTNAETVRIDRLSRLAIEAAEQTERLDVPSVAPAQRLLSVLGGWSASRTLVFADEAGEDNSRPWGGPEGRAASMADVVMGLPDGPVAILIGPEGGFSPGERDRLRSLPFVRPAGLGPRILRAETAAVAALAIWQALRGDWRAR